MQGTLQLRTLFTNPPQSGRQTLLSSCTLRAWPCVQKGVCAWDSHGPRAHRCNGCCCDRAALRALQVIPLSSSPLSKISARISLPSLFCTPPHKPATAGRIRRDQLLPPPCVLPRASRVHALPHDNFPFPGGYFKLRIPAAATRSAQPITARPGLKTVPAR
jgi:hypothetical protein